ncbi:hypothetical protein NQ314_009004 [Rhamnusium bicolor]|uniref:EF-hand domain-containing protein n=1 Tax=Rhamnusium bicolor TaxID=1586634 RepID=A0AAV8Y3L6_9CUCU|nr:hypothetical protein NQ314_009004 [Rhamnusium bicolor]
MSVSSADRKSSKSSETRLSQTSSVKNVSLTSTGTSRHSGYEEKSLREEIHKVEEGPDYDEDKHKYTFINQPYPRATLEEYQRELLKDEPLFADVLTLDDRMYAEKTSIEQSILVTGFGIRNLQSLQNALQEEEEKRLLELYKYQREESRTTISSTVSSKTTSKSAETETDMPAVKSDMSVQKQKLEYLLGIETEAEEEYLGQIEPLEEAEDQFIYSASVSMKTAQRYLRTHRIFDFFQFIIAHLLSASPENPINFILVLLNKCLMYRSGLGKPPMLYEEQHIEQLFALMDRMKTGFIELDQYRKGMVTLGICSFNKNPPLSPDKMVTKEVFMQEAIDNEIAQFDDLIKRKWTGKKPVSDPKYSDVGSSQSLTGPYFIPSDLLKSYKKKDDSLPKIEEEGGEREGSAK